MPQQCIICLRDIDDKFPFATLPLHRSCYRQRLIDSLHIKENISDIVNETFTNKEGE
jgi:hypothetical protein